jgi:hypothetical protein
MGGAAGQPNIANIFRGVKAKYGHAPPLTCEKINGRGALGPEPLRILGIQPTAA